MAADLALTANVISRCARFPLLVVVSVLAGCVSTGDVSMHVPIAGGERIRVPIAQGGVVEPTETNELRTEAKFTFDATARHLVYAFAVTPKRGVGLKKIRVEDVSGDEAELLLEDAAPVLQAGRWEGAAAPIGADHSRLKWLSTLETTMRVYRFTVTTTDDRVHVLNQGLLFGAGTKSGLRRVFGGNY